MTSSSPYRIETSLAAASELEAAVEYYAERRESLAKHFLKEFDVLVERLSTMPMQFPTFHHQYRRALFRKFPYAMLFRIEKDRIYIQAIQHLKRAPSSWDPNRA